MMSTLTLSAVLQIAMLAGSGQTYEAAYKEHTENNRVLVVLVGTSWCPACQQMKQSVIPQVQKDGTLAKVAYAYVDADREGELAGKLMSGNSVPQIVVFRKTAEGTKRQQLVGGQSVNALESVINQAVDSSTASLTSATSDNMKSHN
jgi:thioredoxin-like negative regulator of GroEL